MKKLPTLNDLPDVKGRYVLLRASLNVPVEDGVVTNQFRIYRALPTINKLRTLGARIIIVAHIGREPELSLKPVYDVLEKQGLPIAWTGRISGDLVTEARNNLNNGDILLLENIRQDTREIENDESLAKELAELADIYINDAFAASHRDHASLSAIAKLLPTYFGLNFMHEYDELTKALEPAHPSLFIIGGAKFETKLPLVEKLLPNYEHIFIGGALVNDIFKARGYEVGTSLVATEPLNLDHLLENEKILLPVDVVVVNGNGESRNCLPTEVKEDESIMDAGPATLNFLQRHITQAKAILWNGPLGNFEKGFGEQTKALALLVSESSAYTIVGGGDTIAAIEELGCQEKYAFMSTAGGAMMTYLEHGTLPTIEAAMKE